MALVHECARNAAADAKAGPEQVYRMLCANPAAGRAFCRFMVGRIGGTEPGSARQDADMGHVSQQTSRCSSNSNAFHDDSAHTEEQLQETKS